MPKQHRGALDFALFFSLWLIIISCSTSQRNGIGEVPGTSFELRKGHEREDAMLEPMLWHDWYPLAAREDVVVDRDHRTLVLGLNVTFRIDQDGNMHAYREDDGPCRVEERYAVIWVCLSERPRAFFKIPEFEEIDRRIVSAGSMRLHVSGLRLIENFLDMAHFPFVHTNLLGAEPRTEVKPYTVAFDETEDEIIASDCTFMQPKATANAGTPLENKFIYRVARPYVAILYKIPASSPDRWDVLCMFVQPLTEEWCVAHAIMMFIDDISTNKEIRSFQQSIFSQDLTILVNQVPKRLPLTTHREVPVRADVMSSAYRRWLRERGVRFGAT